MSNKKDIALEQTMIEINELLNEIKSEQVNQRKIIEQNHRVNMRKFAKILEFNEIVDMTNQIFEKRLSHIEKILYEVFEK